MRHTLSTLTPLKILGRRCSPAFRRPSQVLEALLAYQGTAMCGDDAAAIQVAVEAVVGAVRAAVAAGDGGIADPAGGGAAGSGTRGVGGGQRRGSARNRVQFPGDRSLASTALTMLTLPEHRRLSEGDECFAWCGIWTGCWDREIGPGRLEDRPL